MNYEEIKVVIYEKGFIFVMIVECINKYLLYISVVIYCCNILFVIVKVIVKVIGKFVE